MLSVCSEKYSVILAIHRNIKSTGVLFLAYKDC